MAAVTLGHFMTDSLTAALSAGERLADDAYRHIRFACERDGRVDPARLDEHQLAIYRLAFSSAELRAARHALGCPLDELERDLARAFSAEALGNLREALAASPADYGVERPALAALDNEAADHYRSAAFLAGLGERIELNPDATLGARDLDADKRLMRDTFQRFADEVVRPRAEAIHRKDLLVPDGILSGVRDLGCFGLSVPERFGGLLPDDGEDSLGMIIATEELSRGSLGAAGSLITRPEIMARALLEGGTEAQKARWLPVIASGEKLVAISVTEPDAGSDVAAVALKARRDGSGWRLDGGKTWCTFAGKADVMLVLARTDPNPALGHRGLSLFLVEKPSTDGDHFDHSPAGGGRVSGRAIATIGYRGMHSFDVHYDDFYVPHDNLVGGDAGIGRGFYYTMRGFSGGRIQTAARANGLMQAAFEAALAHAGQRRVFGKTVGEFQLTRFKLARMAYLLLASRLYTYHVAGLMDAGGGQMEASLVKLYACKAAEWVCREAMQIHGGMGYAEECPVSRYFLDARVLSIFEGAEETLALKVVGRTLIEAAGN